MANLNLQINARGTNVSAQRRDNNVVIDIDNTATEAATVAAGAATATALAAATSVQQIGEQVRESAEVTTEAVQQLLSILAVWVPPGAVMNMGSPINLLLAGE